MHVKHITGIGLTSRRLTRQQRYLAMGSGVLRQGVNHDQRMLAAIAEILGHGETGKGCNPLQSRRACRSGNDDDAALGCSAFLDRIDGAAYTRALLANRDVDTDDVARFLIDNRVDRDRRLADGTIADDEFALAAAEREQGIDDDETGLNWLDHEIPIDNRRCRALNGLQRVGRYWSFTIEWPAEWIDDATEHCRPHGNAHDISRAAHHVASLDCIDVVQQNTADPVALEYLSKSELSFIEAQQLV